MKLPSKSKQAFLFSSDCIKPNKNGDVYLWTFTFKDVVDVAVGRKAWSGFLKKLRRMKRYLNFFGIRVFELHPGGKLDPGGHGLHIHVVTSCFLQINQVRALWKLFGGGRVHVKPIPASRCGYLAKYLTKSGRSSCFKGARMWAAFGGCDHTKVKDVTIESNWTKTYALLKSTVRFVSGMTFSGLRWFERLRAVDNVQEGNPWYTSLACAPVFDSAGTEVFVYQGNLGGARVY
jgi:hypothetical protein